VYFLTAFLGSDALFQTFGLVPERFIQSFGAVQATTVFTAMFVHADLWHLLGNLLFLYIFGKIAEPILGKRQYTSLYFLSGVGAALTQLLAVPFSTVPMVGASGAISGVLAAAMLLRPREEVVLITPITLFIPVRLTLWKFGLGWIGLQVVGGLGFAAAGGVAFWAHIGGFVTGHLVNRILRRFTGMSNHNDRLKVWPGAAPNSDYYTFFVTDHHGTRHLFHEPHS
jgi:membrane associated rhomboid family serine protease